MENGIIACDFDGTVTKKDSLYSFFEDYAPKKWLEIEQMWKSGKIGSKTCLTEEFNLFNNLNEDFINSYIETIELDPYFKDFQEFLKCKNLDFIIVSDGIDYFIKKILKKENIKDIKIISNQANLVDGKIKVSFPNISNNCKNNAGTCKCKAIEDLRKNYKKIFYIGDGFSDFCAAKNADYIFAKNDLAKYLKENNIDFISYSNFKEVMDNACFK